MNKWKWAVVAAVVVSSLFGVYSAGVLARDTYRATGQAHETAFALGNRLGAPANTKLIITDNKGQKRLISVLEVLELIAQERAAAAQAQVEQAEAQAKLQPPAPTPPR